jgi:hypothetical protein
MRYARFGVVVWSALFGACDTAAPAKVEGARTGEARSEPPPLEGGVVRIGGGIIGALDGGVPR